MPEHFYAREPGGADAVIEPRLNRLVELRIGGDIPGLAMENLTNFAFIPAQTRRIITGALLLACLVLLTGIAAMIVMNRATYLSTVLDLTKLAFYGLGIWVFLLYNSRTLSTEQLLSRTEAFLTKEVTRTLSLIERPAGRFGEPSADIRLPARVTTLPSETRIQCYYEIASQQLGALRLHIQCNVSRMLVVYFLDPELAEQHGEIQKNTITGAESAGWKSHMYGVKKADFLVDAPEYYELMFERTLERDFLFSSSEQLFIANDIAMMTRSIMLERHRFSGEARPSQCASECDV
ncbi:hypothetical protein D0B32_03330 [Paraburkholderia sp. DHOC27]|nr:hypothetical protein D0B32_03330 [Paraburkholderia sp. DHOC27]